MMATLSPSLPQGPPYGEEKKEEKKKRGEGGVLVNWGLLYSTLSIHDICIDQRPHDMGCSYIQ